MTYLNDVDEGGQTAFVYADNATYPQAVRFLPFMLIPSLTD